MLGVRQSGFFIFRRPAQAPFGDPEAWVMHVLETTTGSTVIGEPFSRND